MRMTGLVLLLLAGCAASPTGTNATTDRAPPPAPAPPGPPQGPGADAYRAAVEANEAPFHVPGTITARLNEEVQIGDLRVKPLAVLEDSRCPVDVACVWAGRVRLRVQVSGMGEQVIVDIAHRRIKANERLLAAAGRRGVEQCLVIHRRLDMRTAKNHQPSAPLNVLA